MLLLLPLPRNLYTLYKVIGGLFRLSKSASPWIGLEHGFCMVVQSIDGFPMEHPFLSMGPRDLMKASIEA